MSYVAIEFDEVFNFVCNVYGPFPSLEEAESFRTNHPSRYNIDCFLVIDPSEESS